MFLEVIDRAPEARCYQCGSTDIRSVCHHCSRPMCARHGSVAVRERVTSPSGAPGATGVPAGSSASGGVGSPGDELDGPDTRPISREFAGLKLLPIRAAVHHCEDHDHIVGRLMAGIKAVNGVFGGRPTPVGDLPPLPVFPDVNAVSVVERLTGDVQLTEAGYVSTLQHVEGEIAIGMTHPQARWQETMGRYRKRHQLPEDYPVTFAAGFAMLRGQAGLAFDAGQDAVLPDGLGLAFHGDVGGHDLFDAKRGRPQGEWELSARYKLQSDRAPQDIPLWIVPSLGATSGKRVLVIDLHWNMPEVDGSRVELNRFELIEFLVPHQWGNLKSSSPPGAASSAPAPGQPRIIRWRQHRPAADDRRHRSGPAAAPQSMTLRLEFEKSILDQPWLSGSLRATFDRTLSGVTGIDFYLPGGGPVRYLDVKPRTEISVRFDISLSALRYQERRAVPDDSQATGEDESRRMPDEFSGVVPDYRTVAELTNAISADGYYVKTVVEDHPNRDLLDRTIKRGWDITGRWYEGVFPINFIISLHGTEPQASVAGQVVGRTAVKVTVDGTFPNAEMKKKIEDKWDGLHARVTELLAARAVHLGDTGPNVTTHGLVTSSPQEITAPADPPQAISAPSAPSPARPGVPGYWESPGENVVAGEVIDRHEVAVPGDEAELAAELQRQRKDLRLLLGESDIGERVCQEAIADLRAELRYLEQREALHAGPPDRRTEAEVADLLRQRRGLRGKLIAGQMSEDFYRDEVADINAELKNFGWSQ
jgi:hypothetical protein